MREILLRPVVALVGMCLLGLGIVGAFVPLMPSTMFFIGAAACFAYASPRLEGWLLSIDFVGRPIRAWRERGAISIPSKLAATLGMSAGIALYAMTGPSAWVLAAVAVVLVLCAAFIWSRPN